ncbi:hypothetical protein ACLOJK_023884 [Asimina triloba]
MQCSQRGSRIHKSGFPFLSFQSQPSSPSLPLSLCKPLLSTCSKTSRPIFPAQNLKNELQPSIIFLSASSSSSAMEELRFQVAQAVHVLNHDSESCNRVAANQWLVQFQQTHAAWEVATSILTADRPIDLELEFFAAQILKRKIQNEGYYLQLGAKDALLNALLLAAKRFSSGPPQLLTQVCLALSALVIRAVEHKKPIERLFCNLDQLRSQENGNIAVLEMLTVLPEEVIDDQNSDCNISSDRRCQYAREV